eukprot:994262-Prorocentrum_minimum.AAC.1
MLRAEQRVRARTPPCLHVTLACYARILRLHLVKLTFAYYARVLRLHLTLASALKLVPAYCTS